MLTWIRQNLFARWVDGFVTLALLALAALTIPGIIRWAIVDAIWEGSSGRDCAGFVACWPFIGAKLGQFVYGAYPDALRWRVNLAFFLGIGGLALLMIRGVPHKGRIAFGYLLVYPPLAFVLLVGGFGLKPVPTYLWGGLLVTVVVAASGIAASLPLGILLALGRRSTLPIVRTFSIAFIELWRGVPLVTVLFMASVMLPLFLPPGVTFDILLRCLIGVALFSAAYMAEVVRGGLQAIPRGQMEAATALGFGYWASMGLIVLPQALRLVVPGIVNTFIGLFKDTTLVLIVGLADLLGMVQRNLNDPEWSAPGTAATGYLFAAFVFWVFCFAMSRYAIYVEKRTAQGEKR